MHVVVSWDIKAENPRWKEINEEFKACLEEYSWIKALTTLYIVQVEDAHDRLSLKRSLTEICRKQPERIHLLMSPAMQGGSYGGWLPKSLWPKIQERVEGAA